LVYGNSNWKFETFPNKTETTYLILVRTNFGGEIRFFLMESNNFFWERVQGKTEIIYFNWDVIQKFLEKVYSICDAIHFNCGIKNFVLERRPGKKEPTNF
jgi:hypothetical protein